MIFNKGTVSFDQWFENLKEKSVAENFSLTDVEQQQLQNIYWSGADTDEALLEISQLIK